MDSTAFADRVTALLARQNDMTVEERNEAVAELCEVYVQETGETPPSAQLERLSNFILGDALRSRNKRGTTPVYTDNQLQKRARRAGETRLIED